MSADTDADPISP